MAGASLVDCATGASIAVLKQQIGDFLTTKGITQAELERTINGSIDILAALNWAAGVAVPGAADGPVRLVDAGGLVAIAEPRGGELKPVVGFRPG